MDNSIRGLVDSPAHKCVKCNRELANFNVHHACNYCHAAPLCIGCILRDHRSCDCFNLGESIVRFINTATNWMDNVCSKQLTAVLAERCRLQHAIDDVQNQLPIVGGDLAELVERTQLREALKIAILYDQIEESLAEFRTFLNELYLYISHSGPTSLAVPRFKEAKECFDRLSRSLDQLQNSVARKEVDKFLQLRRLLLSFETKKISVPIASADKENAPPDETQRGRKRTWSRRSAATASKNMFLQPKANRRSKSVCEK